MERIGCYTTELNFSKTMGMTLEEIKASNLSKEYDEEWGSGFIKPERFIDILYSDLTKED